MLLAKSGFLGSSVVSAEDYNSKAQTSFGNLQKLKDFWGCGGTWNKGYAILGYIRVPGFFGKPIFGALVRLGPNNLKSSNEAPRKCRSLNMLGLEV